MFWRRQAAKTLRICLAHRHINNIIILAGEELTLEAGLRQHADTEKWKHTDPNVILTLDAFLSHPRKVVEFLNHRRLRYKHHSPTIAHWSLADLERRFIGRVRIVTDNEDNLLEQARVRNVIHARGSLWRTLCQTCGLSWEDSRCLLFPNVCPSCKSKNSLRTTLPFVDENLAVFDIKKLINANSLLIVAGIERNSLSFISLMERARELDLKVIYVGSSAQEVQDPDVLNVSGKCAKILPVLRDLILKAFAPK